MKFVGEYKEHLFTADGAVAVTFIARGQEKLKAVQIVNEMRTSLTTAKEAVKYTIDITKYRPKRSLDANAYFHVLVNKIAEVTKMGNDEIKVKMVLEYGTVARDEHGDKVGVKLPASVNVNLFYKYAKCFDTRIENGKEFNCYILYKRTRDLDSKEMARLIEGVVYEAQALGIETKTPDEIAQLEGICEKQKK